MAKDPYKSVRSSPLLPWVVIGVLLAAVVGLLATYVMRPDRSPAEDARTEAAIVDMDAAQNSADARREEERSATALLN